MIPEKNTMAKKDYYYDDYYDDYQPPKRSHWKTVVLLIVDILLMIILAAVILLCYMTGGKKTVTLNEENLGIVNLSDLLASMANDTASGTEEALEDPVEEEELIRKWTEITNIAIFGIDSTDEQAAYGDKNRSDSIIVVSIDQANNTIKLTNILRDSKVPIEGHDPQKINGAYVYGGAELAIKTLNQNFMLNISDYATVDFAGIEHIVDLLGGITIDVTQEEAGFINEYVSNDNTINAGLQTLNGEQTMLYARIRKIDSDYYRASRQQTVISAILNKIKSVSISQYPTLIREIMSCVETSLTYTEIWDYVTNLDLNTIKMVNNTIPDIQYETDLWGGIDDTGSWVYVYDLNKAASRLHNIIYGN